MSRLTSTPAGLAAGAVTAAALAAGYWLTRQHVFSIDSLYYLHDAEFGGWDRLLHPHHLALQPLQRAWWALIGWFGWPGRAVAPLQALNIALTLAWLAAAWRLLVSVIGHRGRSLPWLGLLAFGYLAWGHATQAEGLPPYALLATLLLGQVAEFARRDRSAIGARGAALMAATLTGAILMHQSLVLWSPLLAWMVGREAVPGRRLATGLGMLAAAGIATLACYLLAASVAAPQPGPAGFWHWVTGYSAEFAGRCGTVENFASADIVRGLASTLLSGAPLKPYVYGGRGPDLDLVRVLLPYMAVGGVLLTGLAGLPSWWRRADTRRRRQFIDLTLLAVVAALFAVWWEPSQRKFWAPVLPVALALSGLGWETWRERARRRRPDRPAPLASVLMGVVALVAVYNLAGGILPRHRHQDASQPLIMFVTRSVGAADTVILAEDRVWQAAEYFLPRRTVHGIPGDGSDRDDPEHTVWRTAMADAERALRQGGVLYVADSQWPAVRAALEPALGPLPTPVPALEFADMERPHERQLLLAITFPKG